MPVDPKLYEYASDRQREFLDAVAEHGSAQAASKALGLTRDIVGRSMRRLKAYAARQGYAPGHFEHGIAPRYARLIRAGRSAEDCARELLPIVRVAARRV